MTNDLPPTVCFRVTRYCNARCGFCLAPPDGAHPAVDILMRRIDWLMARGVRTVHFCGGEPTIHPALPRLLAHTVAQGGKTQLTTNAIAISPAVVQHLRTAGTQIKVSLHGPREYHDALVGRDAFVHTTGNLRRLLGADIPASVQTTMVAGGAWVLDWVVAFCLDNGVSKLSILPFIPRGSGVQRRSQYELSCLQRESLRKLVREKRRALNGRLDLRWLDFTARSICVVEADGAVVLEGATESMDRVLYEIPLGKEPSA